VQKNADTDNGSRGEHVQYRDEPAGNFRVQRKADRPEDAKWKHDMHDAALSRDPAAGPGPARRAIQRNVVRDAPYPAKGADAGPRPAAARGPAVYEDAELDAAARRAALSAPTGGRPIPRDRDLDDGHGMRPAPARAPASAFTAAVHRPFADEMEDLEPAPPRPRVVTRPLQGEIKTGLGAAVTIRNLAPDLDDADVHRLCAAYGPNAVTAFHKLAQSCAAEVAFASRADAVKAVRELHGNELDGDGHVLECSLGKASGPRQPQARLGRIAVQR